MGRKKKGYSWELTDVQVDYLLSGCTLDVHGNTLLNWKKSDRFMQLVEMCKIAKQSQTRGISEAANSTLWEALESEDPIVRLRAALAIKKYYPDEKTQRILVRQLKPVHKKDLKHDVATRIEEELAEDISRKSGKIPVPKVGQTKKSPKRKEPTKDVDELFAYEPDLEFDPEKYWGE